MKGVVLVDINNREILVSRNVTHHEHVFPYKDKHQSTPWSYYPSTVFPLLSTHQQPNSTLISTNPLDSSTPNQQSINTENNETNSQSTNHDTNPHFHDINHSTESDPFTRTNNEPSTSPATYSPNTLPDPLSTTTSARPRRLRHALAHLKDYVCNSSTASHDPISSRTTHPISHFHSFLHLSPSHKAFSASLSHTTEPSPMMRHVSHMIGLMP
jgi:hypothetical protein